MPLFLGARGTIGQLLFLLPLGQDEVIIISQGAPWTWRYFAHFHELPIRHIGGLKSEIITHSR